MELCRLISECICTKCCNDVMPFSSVSVLKFDLLIRCNFATNKFFPNCYSMNDDYYVSPLRISEPVCNNLNKSLLIAHFNTTSLDKNKN